MGQPLKFNTENEDLKQGNIFGVSDSTMGVGMVMDVVGMNNDVFHFHINMRVWLIPRFYIVFAKTYHYITWRISDFHENKEKYFFEMNLNQVDVPISWLDSPFNAMCSCDDPISVQ